MEMVIGNWSFDSFDSRKGLDEFLKRFSFFFKDERFVAWMPLRMELLELVDFSSIVSRWKMESVGDSGWFKRIPFPLLS